MINIGVSGACGRMGQRIIALSAAEAELKTAGALEAADNPNLGKLIGAVIGSADLGEVKVTADIADILEQIDVLIDFSSPEASLSYLETLKKADKAMVIGTTGFSQAQLKLIDEAAQEIPVVLAPNMSLGVNVLFALTLKAAELLGPGYDMEIIEAHHNQKKDAPSGTANKLAEILAQVRSLDLKKSGVYGRQGLTGARSKDEIGIHSLRAGDIVGEHTVVFGGTGERIELAHKAQSRDTFAYGALRAAKFIAGIPAGFYNMQDVLGLK